MPDEVLVRVVAPRFVAGFVVQADRVIEAAPILRRRLMGQTADAARAVIARQRWRAGIVQQQAQRPGEHDA